MSRALPLLAAAALFLQNTTGIGVASAASVAVTGSVDLYIGTLPPVTVAIDGDVDVSGGTLTVPAGLASLTGLFIPVIGFPLGLITGVVVTVSNSAGQFSVGGAGSTCPGPFASGRGACVAGGGFGGGMPLVGVYQLKGALAINVPLSVFGADGEPIATAHGGNLVVQGAPWTTGTARVTTTATGAMNAITGSAAGALGAMSSTLTLVSPTLIKASGLSQLGALGRVSLHFVPEPGTFALVGAGLAGIALAARWRGRRAGPTDQSNSAS